VKKKLEENKKNQRVFDKYIDLAVTNENMFAREYRGYLLFVSGHKAVEGVAVLRSAGQAGMQADEILAGNQNKTFYQGDFGACVCLCKPGAFLAVRIGKEIFYVGVKSSDRSAVLDVARQTHCIYDVRALPIQAIARQSKNVVHLAF
tara:strand:+ start:3608 stop:4048 length:441 start_codon:yes stop_codon:yes gene_type:complete